MYRRIFDAADALFARKGYAAVTTQEIADAADVGAGTLFRYANTKAELLIMVMNERLRFGAEHGLGIAERGSSPAESIFGLVEPLLQAALNQPENMAVFQREVLFGADGPYRAQALERIRSLEDAIAQILAAHAGPRGAHAEPDLRRAAEAIFSMLYLRLVRLDPSRLDPSKPATDRHGAGGVNPKTLPAVLKEDVAHLVRRLADIGEPPLSGSPDEERPPRGRRTES